MTGNFLKLLKRPLPTFGLLNALRVIFLLLNDVKSHGKRGVLFAYSVVNNKQNDRVVSFGQDISGVRYVCTTKHPASVMMLGVVASNGEKMPPVLFRRGYRLTGVDGMDIMTTKVLAWIRKIDKDGNYVVQQNDAPTHTLKVVQHWMNTNVTLCPKDFWPLQSLDLNPLVCSVSPYIESRAYKDRHY